MPKRNKELFQAIADQIRKDPHSYDQADWGCESKATPCGTAHCIAGWAAQLSDGQFLRSEHNGKPIYGLVIPHQKDFGKHPSLRAMRSRLSKTVSVSNYARVVLGLTDEDADKLFDANWQPHSYDPDNGDTLPEAVADELERIGSDSNHPITLKV